MEIKIPRIHQTVNNSKKRLYIFWFCVQFFFSAISQDQYQLESKQITIFSVATLTHCAVLEKIVNDCL